MKRIFKRMIFITTTLIGLLVISYFLIINFYPSFGGEMSKERKETYTKSSQFEDGKFVNVNRNAPKQFSFLEMVGIGYKALVQKTENGRPKRNLDVQKLDSTEVANYNKEGRLIWYGHSAFLLQIDGKNILLDPMFGEVPSPITFLGDKRFNKDLPLEIAKLPKIDAIVISHDHYDHLDYESIKKLKTKLNIFTHL